MSSPSTPASNAPAPADSATASAAGRRVLHPTRLVWVAVLVALDLWSKAYMFDWLTRTAGASPPPGVEVWELNGHWRYEVFGDFLGFMLSENRGAAWGFGESVPWLLVGGRVVAGLVLIWMVLRTDSRQRMLLWALVLVLSGALGNLYDNLARTPPPDHPFGAVRDFIHVYFPWGYHFPTFNVADTCITIGAVLLVLSSFLAPHGESEAAEQGAESDSDRDGAADAPGSAANATADSRSGARATERT